MEHPAEPLEIHETLTVEIRGEGRKLWEGTPPKDDDNDEQEAASGSE